MADLDPLAVYAKAVQILWHRVALEYLLHETQVKILALLEGAKKHRKFFFLCSRRLGKSYLLFWLAVRQCLQKPGSRVLYLAPFAKDAKDIATDIAVQILADCPAHQKPEYKAQDREFIFPNGSIIRLKGVNGEHAQYLRGTAADLIILDECGLMDDLAHVVSDVCVPMTATTLGRIILASTPPRTPSHESAGIFEDLSRVGAVATFTFKDAPHIAHTEKIRILVEECHELMEDAEEILAGTKPAQTTTAQRELMCQFVTDAESAVVPEFTAQAEKELCVDFKRPEFADLYVSMDPGMKDRTAVLFAHWDFLEQRIVVEDELILSNPGTPVIARDVKAKETELWGWEKPRVRVSDIDLRLIADLESEHKLSFQKVRKTDLMSMVANMRSFVHGRKLVIGPKCVNLRRQLKNAIWNSRATEFARPEDKRSIDGHYDAVAALMYLCLSIDRSRNPYPPEYFMLGGKHGLPHGTWISPKRRNQKKSLGFYTETPVTKRLMSDSKKKRRFGAK